MARADDPSPKVARHEERGLITRVRALRNEARQHEGAGDAGREIAALESLVALDPSDQKARSRLAELLRGVGRMRDAVEQLRAMAEASPSDPKPWRQLTRLLDELGDPVGEIEVLRRRIELGEGDAATHGRLDRLFTRLGREAEALPHRQAAAAVALGATGSSVRSRRTADDVVELEAEVAQLQSALKRGGDDPSVRRHLYLANYKLRRLEAAAEHMQAWAYWPGGLERRSGGLDSADWDRLTKLLAEIGDVEGEVTALRARLTVDGGDLAAHGRLLRLLARAGRMDAARAHWDVLVAAATDEEAARRVGRLQAVVGIPWGAVPPAPSVEAFAAGGGRLAGHTVVFPHAYKTAGTSLSRGMDRLFAPNFLRLGQTSGRSDLAVLPPSRRAQLDVLAGHFTFDQAEDALVPLLPKAPLYIAAVREPVARARSIYAFFRESYAAELDLLQRLHVPYDDDINVVCARWMESGSDWSGWRGDQCRTICGEPSADRAISTIEAHYLAAVTPSGINPFLSAVAGLLSVEWRKPLHVRSSKSAQFEIGPEMERRWRDYQAEDQKLFDWVRANEDRLAARAVERLGEAIGASAEGAGQADRAKTARVD